jgi:hypothetical protein
LMGTPPAQAGPARRLALIGTGIEIGAAEMLLHRVGMVGEPYREGRPGAFMKTARNLTIAAVGAATLGRRSRTVSVLAGATLQAASVLTRFGVFQAGLASARDPKYTVIPQRERQQHRTGDRTLAG